MKNQKYKYFPIITIYACMTITFSFSQERQHQEKRTTISAQGFKPLKNSEHDNSRDYMRSTQMWYFRSFSDMFSESLDGGFYSDSFMIVLPKLEWVVKINKTTYLPGEPIGISISVRNKSQEDVPIFRYNNCFLHRDSSSIPCKSKGY